LQPTFANWLIIELDMDGGSWVNWNNIAATSWTWAQFPNTFSLSAGSHTLTFAYREDGAQLDKINITTSTTGPTGAGSAASNLCSTGATLAVAPGAVNVAAAVNSAGTFNITSNTSWTVTDNQSWLTVSPTSGSNNGTVTVTAQENTSASARTATVTVSATGVPSRTVTVTQTGSAPYPAMIGVGGSNLNNSALSSMGVAVINFPNNEIAQQNNQSSRGIVYCDDWAPQPHRGLLPPPHVSLRRVALQ
jgi:hypothetical protein